MPVFFFIQYDLDVHSSGSFFLPCQAGPAYAAFFCPAGRAQRRRWTTAGAMHLHPPENSLCYRKFEFPIVLHKREIKSSPEPYRSIFNKFYGSYRPYYFIQPST